MFQSSYLSQYSIASVYTAKTALTEFSALDHISFEQNRNVRVPTLAKGHAVTLIHSTAKHHLACEVNVYLEPTGTWKIIFTF